MSIFFEKLPVTFSSFRDKLSIKKKNVYKQTNNMYVNRQINVCSWILFKCNKKSIIPIKATFKNTFPNKINIQCSSFMD